MTEAQKSQKAMRRAESLKLNDLSDEPRAWLGSRKFVTGLRLVAYTVSMMVFGMICSALGPSIPWLAENADVSPETLWIPSSSTGSDVHHLGIGFKCGSPSATKVPSLPALCFDPVASRLLCLASCSQLFHLHLDLGLCLSGVATPMDWTDDKLVGVPTL